MRNLIKTLSMLIFGSIFFLSCEIGLGASVDTEAPNLEIQNPSPDAIIRGAFKIGGTWSDDGKIETVTVKLTRTDGKGKDIEYQATFAESNNDSPNTWNCIINPLDSANIVLDGNYVAQVDITDTGKHTTTKTVQFAIDNTAPIIVLQRPSTKNDAQQVDSYGQKFTLEGQAADDNNVSLIEVQIFADKECTTLLHTVPLSNVPNSINLDVAEFKENIETDYSKIYGSTQKMGQKNFYCKVVAYDGAVYYPYDRTQTPEDLKGNKTNIYYLYEDIATAVLGEVKITDVYHILSGVYGLEKNSTRSAESNSLITKVKATLEKNVVNTGSFSLNPANNPTFSVSGKEPLKKDENGNVNFAGGNYDITNGSQVIMEVTPGLDNIPLDGSSLKVYCIECDATGTAKSNAIKVYPVSEMKKSGTTYKYTLSVKKQDGLVIGRNYLFGVEGYDEKKNSVVCSDNNGYGFHFTTSGAAPVLTILEPEAGSVTLSQGKKLKISGTTKVEAGTPVITIIDNKEVKKTLTFNESEATEDNDKQLIYNFSTEIEFAGESAYHELEIISDIEGIKTSRTKTVSYDCDAPVIKINSVSPIVETVENEQTKKCLNGEVKITFSLTDDFSFIDTTTNKPYFELWQDNEKKYTATFTSTNSAVTETVTVDTKKLKDKTPVEIKVFAWDRAGNKAELSDKQYQIDQSTDKPQVTPKSNIDFNLKTEEDIRNAGNNENKISVGGTASFTVSDDDGIDYIAVYSQTKDASGKITETLYSRYPNSGSSKETQTPYSFNLPSETGFYSYRLEVKDIITTNADDNNKQEYQFMIKATSPAPTIELQSAEVASENNSDINDGYIGVGGSFTNTITIESIESPFILWEKIDSGEYKKVENIEPKKNNEGKYCFERKVSPTVTTTYYYKVEDSNGQSSNEKSVKCKVDNSAPELGAITLPGKADTRTNQFTFRSTAKDPDSGIKIVEMYFSNDGQNYVGPIAAEGTENWYYILNFKQPVEALKDIFAVNYGEKYVKIKATDKVGLSKETEPQKFFYDTADPTVSITDYALGPSEDYQTYTQGELKVGDTSFSLRGTVSDDWKLKNIIITQQKDDGAPVEIYSSVIDQKEKEWEIKNLPRGADKINETKESGKYNYVITATDYAENKTEVSISVTKDVTKPVITIGDPTDLNAEKFIPTKNFTITGTIEDANFSSATATLLKVSENGKIEYTHGTFSSLDQNNNFTWKVYDVEEGTYKIQVYAEDEFGNNNTITGTEFTVDVTAPTTTLTPGTSTVYNKEGTAVTKLENGSTYYVKGSYALSGTITETNLSSIKVGEEPLTVNDGNTWNKEIIPDRETVTTQTITLEDKAGNKTVYTLYIAKDVSAPLLTVTSPTTGLNAASFKVEGQVTDLGIGVASVSYELYKVEGENKTKVVNTQTQNNVAGSFKFPQDENTYIDLTGEGKGEGKYIIKVTAQDKLNNTTAATPINIVNDGTPPTISSATIKNDPIRNDYTVGTGESAVTYKVYGTDTFDIEVTATDLISGVNTVTAESGNTKVELPAEKDSNGKETGKYKGTITAKLDNKNVTAITIKAIDKSNNLITQDIKNIMVDKVAPAISELTYPSEPKKDKFTVSVNVKDLVALADQNPVILKYKKNETDKDYVTASMKSSGDVYKIELTPGSGTDSDSVHYIPDGTHTFTIVATDKAGNTSEKSFEVVTDTTAPLWSTSPAISSTLAYEQKIKNENGTETETKNYYKSNLINVIVKAQDVTSGVKEILYKLDSGDSWHSNGNSNITLDNLSDGMHTVSIKAVDYAGNSTSETLIIFYIDTKSPLKPTLVSIDSESGEALQDYENESKSKLVNGQKEVTFVLTVQDDSSKAQESDAEYRSGIKKVNVVKIASTSYPVEGENSIAGTLIENSDGQYTVTIPKGKLATGSVSVRITDNVGNTYEGTVFNLQLDNTEPTLKITSPANNATVNKTITISGATTDNNAVADTVVTVKKDGNSVRTETFTAENSNELDWTLDLNTFVDNITKSAEKATLTITVSATDKAGNTASETRTITVDQDSDRPKISFNNVTLGNSMSSSDSNYIWLKNTTVLYGTVEDDDGISSMQISKDGTDWKPVTLNPAKTSWSFDVKNFITSGTDEEKENKANGAHTIYFKLEDSKNQEFVSATSSSLSSVYLVDGENKYGTIGSSSAKTDSVLYVKVDTLAPEVVLTGARIGNSGDFSTSYSNMTLGGSQRTMQFKLTAKDSNGIASITGTAEFDGASITLSSPTEVKAYKNDGTVTSVGASDAEYYIVSFTVDLASAQSGLDGKDGRISLKFTGKDKAGNSSAQTATINYDYKKPEVTITSPKDSSWVSGIVTAYGTIDSTATMYYALSPSNTITPAEADTVITGGNITGQVESGTDNSHQVTSWSGTNPDTGDSEGGTIDVTPKYSQIKGNGVQWFVYFDNQPSTDVATHDVEIKKYLTNYGITTDAAISDKNKPFTTIVNLYLWIKSKDSAGNITETNFPILIDPQGDAPQVEISYPAKSGETLGGAVTLLGTASDTIGSNIGIKNVWVQIMSGKSDTNATPTKDDVNLWINNGYSVYTDIKNDTPTKVTDAIGETVIPANYYIQATVSGTSWSLKINGNGEFSPSEGSKKNVTYRVYAQDYDNNLSKVQTQYCIFDADTPILSDLYLRQYDENGNITASRPYEDDMWIKGDWWLCGTVKDTQGIASLTVNGEEKNVTGNAGHVETFKYKISTNGKDAGNKTISIVAEDKVTPPHPTKKECSINFDNKAPVSKAPEIANKKIQNANGFFTFSAEVTEDAVSGAAQSGFKYLAFYFTRGNNVYDIMRPKADGKSAVDKSDTNIFTTDDGLIWKKLSVTRSSENLTIITLDSDDANIHTGGLCKIGGSIYMIKNVNGTTIELDGSPEKPVGVDNQDALFAIANVVNNNIESGNGTKSTNDSYYGYFESISNDDGDHMVESVLKTGTTWKWEANINSRNIPDGTVTLHYVAFDAAGNCSPQKIDNLQIANNAPRLASLTVWSDYNGNGEQDENEFNTKYYSKKTVVIDSISQTKSKDLTSDLLLSGNDKDESTGGSAFMTIKAETKLIPELVGGNGNLYYTYKIKPNNGGTWSGITKSVGRFATGNDDDIDDEADKEGYYVVDDENTAYISGTIYDGIDTDKKPIVITTTMLEGLSNNTGIEDPTWFEYVIYDSTEGCTSWGDVNDYAKGRLSAKFKVALNVQYNDEVAPKVAIRPFYWNSKTENSVVWDETSGKPLGHIELEGDLTNEIKTATANGTALGNDPKVSGKIKIEGYAFDNIKLKELYVTFAGHKDIGKDINNKVLAATYDTNGIWQKSTTATGIDDTWDFEANDVFNNSEGHLVYWTLTVDTQSVSSANVARLDQTVKVVAKDERGKQGTTTGGLESATSGTQASQKMLWKNVKSSSGAYTMFYTEESCTTKVDSATTDDTPVYLKEKWDYQMDIVPYVTGVKTNLSNLDRRTPSKFDRTALGHYPVRIVTKTQSGSTGDAETVTFEGFNLGSKTTLTVNELSTEEDSTTGGKSAKYVPDVNGIDAINNMNNNNAKGSYNGTINDESSYAEKNNYAYNRQPNNANNNRLTDDIIFDVWEFNSAAAVPISGKIEQPVMKIRPTDGKIGFAFVNGPLYFSMGGSSTTEDYSYQYWMGSYDFFTSVGFTYDDAGNSWGVAAGGDINASHADKFVLMGSKWGVGGYHKDGTYHGINSKRLESIGMKGTKTNTTDTTENFDKQRIRSPSLASTVHSGYTNLYMAYYDTMNDELRFKAGRETEQTAQSYVFKVIRCDTPDSNYAGAWVEPPNNNTSLLANGDTIYLCDEKGNVTDTTAYTLTGYWPDSFATTGQVAFTAKLGDLVCKPFPGTEALKYRENGNFHVFDQGESAYIKVVKSAKSFTGGSFTDYDTTAAPNVYRNGTVSIVAGDGVANYGAGEYVSLAAIPGSDVNNDKVVITWYDTNARTLYYSCNTTPLTNRNGTFNKADGTTGWSTPVAVFSTTDYYYAGEYCKIAVDKNGGIHIAAYDPVNLDLVYAYASSYSSSFTTCVVDSNGVVGSNLTLDVALDNNKNAVPFIGYYATSCIKPKYARFVGTSLTGNIDGSQDDEVTGKWEISVVPTSSIIEMQSNQHNDINIGVWKNSGAITNSTTGESSTNNQSSSYSSVSNGQIYGNGTKNPVLGYAIKYGSSSDTIETAQMK